MIETNKMRNHVTLVGSLRIAFSSLGLIGAIIIYFVLGVALGEVGDDPVALKVLTIVRTWLTVVIGSIAVVGIAGGVGLLLYQPWARILVIIVSAVGCLNIPIGTLLGVYSIWVLLQNETIELFQPGSRDYNLQQPPQ